MTSAITLDDIRAAADRKYGNRVIDLEDGKSVELKNALRLTKAQRDKLQNLNKERDENEDVLDFFKEAFELISSKKEAELIQSALGEDVAQYAALFELYMEDSEVGEASPSQD